MSNPFNLYLKKQTLYEAFINQTPQHNLFNIVVIPAFNEPNLEITLHSLANCLKPKFKVEVIVVLNYHENAEPQIIKTHESALKIIENFSKKDKNLPFKLFAISATNLPAKHAGVGLARKIGMDEAIRRFNYLNTDGVITCFDADSTCAPNYLIEIENAFLNTKVNAASIYFEHPLDVNQHGHEIIKAIINYEVFLRVYRLSLVVADFPYAYHTIGSSMAVRASVYQKQGGMNKRKAGEDFYFLQKVMPLGNFIDLKTTTVFPSPRASTRVPFGTGRAVLDTITGKKTITGFHPNAILELKLFFNNIYKLKNFKLEEVELFYNNQPTLIRKFIGYDEFKLKWNEIVLNSSNHSQFLKRFFNWFDAFMVLKYHHFVRDNFYKNVDLNETTNFILKWFKMNDASNEMISKLLLLRNIEKKMPVFPAF